MVLQIGRTISGRIVDLGGSPIAGRVVTAFCFGVKSNDVVTMADGTYQIGSLPEPDGTIDEWGVIVRTWTGTNTRVLGERHRVAPGSDDVDFAIDRIGEASATVVGRVVAEQAQLPGDLKAIIGDQNSAGGSSLTIDPDTGAFSKGPLLPGTYRIRVFRAGVPVIAQSSIAVGPGETIDAGVIHLDDGGAIEVRPALPAALPIEAQRLAAMLGGAAATMVGPGDSEVELEWSDGSWRHAGTLEAGGWRVVVLAEGLSIPERAFTLQPGELKRVELAVALGRQIDVRVDLPTDPHAWSEVKIDIRDGAGQLLYDGPLVQRADLQNPSMIRAQWTVPLETIRISVTTDTKVSAEESVTIPPGVEKLWTSPIFAR